MTGESSKFPVYLTPREEKELEVIRRNYDKLMIVLKAMTDRTTRQCIVHIDENGAIRQVQTMRIDFHS